MTDQLADHPSRSISRCCNKTAKISVAGDVEQSTSIFMGWYPRGAFVVPEDSPLKKVRFWGSVHGEHFFPLHDDRDKPVERKVSAGTCYALPIETAGLHQVRITSDPHDQGGEGGEGAPLGKAVVAVLLKG